jgi:hypothetical protein
LLSGQPDRPHIRKDAAGAGAIPFDMQQTSLDRGSGGPRLFPIDTCEFLAAV